MRKSEARGGEKKSEKWRLRIRGKREVELDSGFGWIDWSRVETRKNQMEVRQGRMEGNNLMVEVLERMMTGEGNFEAAEQGPRGTYRP